MVNHTAIAHPPTGHLLAFLGLIVAFPGKPCIEPFLSCLGPKNSYRKQSVVFS
jgi:hypothetical protein